MRFSRVKINNFRNFQDFDIELQQNVILLGENAVGKTNFLDALRLVLDAQYNPLLSESDFHNGLPKFCGTEIEVNVQFTDFMGDDDKDFLTKVQGCLVSDDPPTAQVSFLYRPISIEKIEEATGPDYYEKIIYGGNDKNNKLSAREFRKHVRLQIVPALRDIDRDSRVWQRSPLRRLTEAMNLSTNPDFQDVASKVAVATTQLQAIESVKQLQDGVRKRLTKMVEGAYAFDPKIGMLPSNPDELQKVLTLLVESDLSLDRTSLGFANILYLTLLMFEIELKRQAKGREKQYQYTILAIEEPESHLHPHLQRLVFRDFLKSSIPILLSTHSPNIVSVCEPEWFLLLKKDTHGTKAASTSKLATLPNFLKRDLSRYLDSIRGEVVFAKGIILVEGDAEEFLVPAFGKVMKDANFITYTLDGAGISVCNVSGTDFEPYVHFFGPQGLDLPLAVITDGDKNVGLKREVKNILKKKRLDSEQKTALRNALISDDFLQMRTILETLNSGWYEGLNRGIKLAKFLDRSKSQALREIYKQQKWSEVREGLGELGIFVNDWTLEIDLIEIGYEEELISAYSELGASERKQANLRKFIFNRQIDKVLNRIEESGKGKGRFAQRLADKLDANKIPTHIRNAIEYIVLRIPKPAVSEAEKDTDAVEE